MKLIKSIKRIHISIFTLAIIFVLFGTGTYAWMSLATINSIDGISLGASTGNEMQISLDGVNFTNELQAADLLELFEDIRLTDVTSTDGITFYTGGLREIGEAITNQDYLSFDLWLQTTRSEKNVFLIDNISEYIEFDSLVNGTFVVSQGSPWVAEHTFQNGPLETDLVERGEQNIYYASEAIRIAVIEVNDDLNPLDLRAQSELHHLLFDPSENPERGFGHYYGAHSYFVANTRFYIMLPTVMQNTSYRLSEFDPNNPYLALDDESQVATMIATQDVDEEGKTIYRSKVRINIWVEGWDADAFLSIAGDRVRIQLQFKIANLITNNENLN